MTQYVSVIVQIERLTLLFGIDARPGNMVCIHHTVALHDNYLLVKSSGNLNKLL